MFPLCLGRPEETSGMGMDRDLSREGIYAEKRSLDVSYSFDCRPLAGAHVHGRSEAHILLAVAVGSAFLYEPLILVVARVFAAVTLLLPLLHSL